MVDSLSPEQRSEIMARVRSKNSRPELAVRKIVSATGLPLPTARACAARLS